MSDRIEWFSITVPAGTPKSAPVTFPCVFQQGYVIEVDIKVPPGPTGNLGFFIAAGGSQYIPRTIGSFVMPDNDYITWPLTNAIDSGSWAVVGFNTGIYDHTIQVGFQINELGTAHLSSANTVVSSSDLIPAEALAPTVTSSPLLDPLSPDFLLTTVPDLSSVSQ